nr:ribonuclease H-like domain-containing protein [Tanacetum cinerariifolium]
MVACLEKTEGNSEFHEIMDFLTSSTIHHALTVSPTIYTCYIEKFWNTASSQTLNDEKQIHATVDRKAVVVTEASIRSLLLFNDANGTACLTNEGRLSEETKELAFEDESWVDAMQEELLQFKIQKVWIPVDLPFGKKAIGTK